MALLRTVVTFADFPRDQPVVTSVDWPEFVLLFNSDDDVIRIRQRWTPAASSADFALQVKLDAEEPRSGWDVQTHPDSPSPMWSSINRIRDDDAALTSWTEDEQPSRRMSPGGVLHFSFLPNGRSKDIGMMLHFEEEAVNEEAVNDERSVAEEAPKLTLEQLPGVVFRRILGHLRIETIMYTLPFVSTEMFRIAKSGGCRRSLDLKFVTWSSAHQNALVKQVHRSVTSLVPRRAIDDELAGNMTEDHVTLFVKFRWCMLTELDLSHCLNNRASLPLIKMGLRKGNFPVLKTLKLGRCHWIRECWLMWTDLEDWPLRTVTFLQIAIGHPSKVENGRKFWQQFVALETLFVHISNDQLWNGEVFPDPECPVAELLPKLRTLKISGITNHAELARTKLQAFAGPITSLHLGWLSDGPDEDRFQGSWLFRIFPELRILSLREEVGFDWSSAPDWGLKNLTGFKAALYEPDDEIPTHKMVNLESACLAALAADVGVENVQEMAQSSTFKNLLRLPKLTTLKIPSRAFLLSLISFPSNGGSSPGILALDLSELCFEADDIIYNSDDDFVTHEFLTLLSSLSQLVSLKLPYGRSLGTAQVVQRILVAAKGLRYMEFSLPWDLRENLKPWLVQREWDVTFSSSSQRVSAVRRAGSVSLPDKLFLFDDEEFFS